MRSRVASLKGGAGCASARTAVEMAPVAHEGLIGRFIVAAGKLVGQHMRAEPIDLRQPFKKPAHCGVEGDAIIAEQAAPPARSRRAAAAKRGPTERSTNAARDFHGGVVSSGDNARRHRLRRRERSSQHAAR
jgi:hypothetical protein